MTGLLKVFFGDRRLSLIVAFDSFVTIVFVRRMY